MNLGAFGRSLRRWWWVLALTTIVTGLAAFAYSEHQAEQFEASSTVFAHPASSLTTPSQSLQQISALAYGSLMQTFTSFAESPAVVRQAVDDLSVAHGSGYRAQADVLPKSTVLRISVDGPDRTQAIRLANRVAAIVAEKATKSFPTVAVTRLDAATSASLTRPKTARNVLYGTLAGLLVGLALVAVLPVGPPLRRSRGSRPGRDADAPHRDRRIGGERRRSRASGSSRGVERAAPEA